MPVPTLITDLSTTAASNSPAGSDTPVDTDNYLRALSAFIAQNYANKATIASPTFTGTVTIPTLVNTAASGVAAIFTGSAGNQVAEFRSGAATDEQLYLTATGTRTWSLKVATSGGAFAIRDTGGSRDNLAINVSGNHTIPAPVSGVALAVTGVSGRGALSITTHTPASAGATGSAGEMAWDSSYIYVCTATNTWKRAALASW